MADTPSWLDSNNNGPTAAPMEPTNTTTLDSPNKNSASEPTSITADDKDLPSIILYMRLANMGAAVALITISVSEE
jgi:hypothetical protein